MMADDPDAVARAVASDADVEAKVYHYVTGKMGGPYSDKTAVWLAAEHNKLRALRFLLAAAERRPRAPALRTSAISQNHRFEQRQAHAVLRRLLLPPPRRDSDPRCARRPA